MSRNKQNFRGVVRKLIYEDELTEKEICEILQETIKEETEYIKGQSVYFTKLKKQYDRTKGEQ